MSDVREKIEREVYEATVHAGEWERGQQATSRILALIAEAMLSDESVETTARSVVAADPSNADTWEALSPYMQEVMVAYARSHAIAALAAAGIATVQGEGIA